MDQIKYNIECEYLLEQERRRDHARHESAQLQNRARIDAEQ
jgi:hypothetical protein